MPESKATSNQSRTDQGGEQVVELPLAELHPFKNHPFKVKDDDAMMETADSIRQYGVLVPAIARPSPEGGYELIAGHRRHRACELAEKETMPVIVRDLDDDAATIIMVDSNLQRESLLPSERAFAYKMKLEAIKHQGARHDLTSRQVGEKSQTSIQAVAEQAGESQRQVQRYIRLTELIPPLLDMVDEKKIAFNPAYELSFLTGVCALPRAYLRTGNFPRAPIWRLCRNKGLHPLRRFAAIPAHPQKQYTRLWRLYHFCGFYYPIREVIPIAI